MYEWWILYFVDRNLLKTSTSPNKYGFGEPKVKRKWMKCVHRICLLYVLKRSWQTGFFFFNFFLKFLPFFTFHHLFFNFIVLILILNAHPLSKSYVHYIYPRMYGKLYSTTVQVRQANHHVRCALFRFLFCLFIIFFSLSLIPICPFLNLHEFHGWTLLYNILHTRTRSLSTKHFPPFHSHSRARNCILPLSKFHATKLQFKFHLYLFILQYKIDFFNE